MKDTLVEKLEQQASRFGEKVFMESPETGDTVTFEELRNECRWFQKKLLENGAVKQERIILFLENGIDFAVSFFGSIYSGLAAVPVNFSYKKKELDYVKEDSEASYLITSKRIYQERAELFADFACRTVELEEKDLVLLIFKEAVLETAPEEINRDDLALLLYTSGTTGNPKGVMLTHFNLLAEASNIAEAHEFTERDITVCILPFFHINGLVITLLTPMFVGMKAVVPAKFSASGFWNWIEKYKVTWFSAVPTIYSILLSKEKDETKDYRSLRFARSASAPLPVAVLEEFEERYGVPVIESFGISEGGSQITANPLPPKVRKAGSVGMGFGNTVQIVDESGNIRKPFEKGEIIVRGGNIAAGYWRKPDATGEAFIDGWFHTGDLGYMDEEGYLFISGRKKELINRAGEKFSPREIDEVLYQIPEIEIAAALGVPDELYNEEVVAYIKLKDGESISAEYIKAYCKTKLADFKVPKEIFFTDDFPKGPSGKIQRLKFIDRYIREKGNNVHSEGTRRIR